MKLNIKSKFYKVMLSFALLLTTAQAVFASGEDNKLGNENISVITEKIYDEETNTVDIKLTLEAKNKNVSLEGVTFPDESKKIPTEYVKESEVKSEDNTYIFTVGENGEYEFQANYALEVVGEDEQPLSREETYGFKVNVDEILVENLDIKELTSAKTRTTVTNGVVTLNIPDYDGVGWDNEDIKSKTVSVTVDFEQADRPNKLEITIPEGLRITSMYVTDGTDVSGISDQSGVVAKYGSASPHAGAITKMTVPQEEKNPMKSVYGTLTYEFNDSVESITIDLDVRIDEKRYYGPHSIPGEITAVAYKVDGQAQQVGDAKQAIEAIGEAPFMKIEYSTRPSVLLIKSTPENTTRGSLGAVVARIRDPKGNEVFAKNITYNFTYPKEFTVDKEASNSAFKFISEDINEGSISFQGKWRPTSYLGLSYELPLSVDVGIYQASKKISAEYVFYDGHTVNLEIGDANPKVSVVDKTENKLAVGGSSAKDVSGVPNHIAIGPGFAITNKSGGIVTNQIFEMIIDGKFQTTKVNFPVQTAIGVNASGKIYYTTTKDNTERVYVGEYGYETQYIKYIDQNILGLDSDEYITSVRVTIGDFGVGYQSSAYSHEFVRVAPIGYIPSGMGVTSVTVNVYDENDKANTFATNTQTITESSDVAAYSNSSLTYSKNTIQAGESYSVHAKLALRDSQGDMLTGIYEPEIYIREVAGHTLNIDSIKLTDYNGKPIDWVFAKSKNLAGENIFTIKTQGYTMTHQGTGSTKPFGVKFDVSTTVRSDDEFPAYELITFGKPGMRIGTDYSWILNKYTEDVHDLNGNGDVTDKILTVSTNPIKVVKYDGIIVETFLSLEGEDPKAPYVPGNKDTVAYFTPGTNADYTVTMTNNGAEAASVFAMYVPIPKTNASFSGNFQSDAFKWDMTLSKPMTAVSGYNIEYSTDANGDNYHKTATYTTTPPANLADVKMIRISASGPVAVNESATFKVPLKVDETFLSATEDGKVGSMNVYSPVYRVESPKFTGELPGTLVGTELVMAEIKGTIFEDVDGDGLYETANGDLAISGHEVKLYEWNDISQKYEPVMINGVHASTISDSNGEYEFNDTHNLGYGDYAIEFVEKAGGVYQYTINTANPTYYQNDSDAIIKNDLPNAGDTYRGWVIGITATNPSAQYLGVGFLEYNPPVDLKVAIDGPSEVKSLESINLNATMEPEFWEKIKDSNKPYTWEIIGGATEQAKATLTLDPSTGGVRLTAASLASGKTTVKVKLTILDIYGYEAESNELEITILSTEKPVITVVTNPTFIEYGETALDEAAFIDRAGISAKDNEGTEISFTTDFDSVVDQTVLDDYTVTITATDSFGNTATRQMTVTVQDKTPPVITLAKDTHTVEMGPEVTFESIIAAFYAKATDTYDPSVTVTNNIAEVVKLDTAGSYTVTFTATDTNGNTSTKTATVVIKDGTPPNITFTKQNVVVEINSGQTHEDILVLIGASVTDNSGETLTLSNNITTVKLDTIGTYPVIFTAEDSNGNKASKTATVKVQDTTPPVIKVTILEKTVEINGDDTHASILAEINAKVTDNSKEKITIIDTITEVKLDTVGTYNVTFNAKDSS